MVTTPPTADQSELGANTDGGQQLSSAPRRGAFGAEALARRSSAGRISHAALHSPRAMCCMGHPRRRRDTWCAILEHERLCADAIIASAGDTKIGRDRRVMRDGRGRRLRSVCAERDSERASERVQMRENGAKGASTPSKQCVVASPHLPFSGSDLELGEYPEYTGPSRVSHEIAKPCRRHPSAYSRFQKAETSRHD